MRIAVFDTETIGLEKTFCYNIGLVIYDTDTHTVITKEDFVVEQIWNNKPLFETAYYANKKPIYVNRMRSGQTIMKKFGHITQHIAHLFEVNEVEYVYAYNSPFDDKVMKFNADWFHCINPFDNKKILDIRGLAHQYIAFTPDFQNFCEENQFFTEAGNYSTTAETVYRYIKNNLDFEEEHTALADSIIELEILNKCIVLGGEYGKNYKVYRSVPRKTLKTVTVERKGCGMCYNTTCEKIKVNKDFNGITLIIE